MVWSSAAVACLLEGSMYCGFRDTLLHTLVATNELQIAVAFLSAQTRRAILRHQQPSDITYHFKSPFLLI